MMQARLEDVLETSFLDYGAFVLQRRALPDVRDGLKYTARQILHAQKKDKFDSSHKFNKSQKSVAAATGFSYVHGDTSCYGQIIHMGRPLVIRYPLESINGNSGTPTGSKTYSAPRYTEARLSEISEYLFSFLDEKVLAERDWEWTYDESGKFPLVLPSFGFYNLCNGAFGAIGVGLISSIPQFNLREMNEAICALIDNPAADISLLPDFASGGVLLNPKTTAKSLGIGTGKSALIRGVIQKNVVKKYLDIIELPYGVYTDTVCEELNKALDKGTTLFTDYKDLSKKSVHIRIYSSKLDALEAWLYKNTSVQKYFTISLTMLGRQGTTPRAFSLQEALLAHIGHVRTVFGNHCSYNLSRLQGRQEILDGFIKAHSIMDEVIAIVRQSNGKSDSVKNLMKEFDFSEPQATAIASMALYQLGKTDIAVWKKELEENLRQQDYWKTLLLHPEKADQEIKTVYQEVANRFGDDRRTKIYTASEEFENFNEEGRHPTTEYSVGYVDDQLVVFTEDDGEWVGDNITMLAEDVQPDENLEFVVITNTLRAILKTTEKVPLGFSKISLKPNEKVLGIFNKNEVAPGMKYVWFYKGQDCFSTHISNVLFNATPRGKKITSGTHNMDKYEFMPVAGDKKL